MWVVEWGGGMGMGGWVGGCIRVFARARGGRGGA